MANKCLSKSVDGMGEVGGPVNRGSRARKGSMVVEVGIHEMVDRRTDTVTEEDGACLEVGDAEMETVNVVREFGDGGRKIVRSKVGAAEGTTKKANAGSDFRGSIAVRREEVKGGGEGRSVGGGEKGEGRDAGGRRKQISLFVVDNNAVRTTKSREAIKKEENILMGKKGGSVVEEGESISSRRAASGGPCSKFVIKLREDDVENEGGEDRT